MCDFSHSNKRQQKFLLVDVIGYNTAFHGQLIFLLADEHPILWVHLH